MTQLFLKFCNMSISASYLVVAVLVLRVLFKKAPKWVNVLLWGIVAVRLMFPFSFESELSLIPSAETISPTIMMDQTPSVQTGIPVINNVINPVIGDSFAPGPGDSANPLQIWIPIMSIIWMVGVSALILYSVVSYWRLRRRVSEAVILRDNIYQCENVGSPFVLGFFNPRIYLPYKMNDQDLIHVVAHEQAHIRRKDHWWKPLGFLLLTIYWFNPLMWISYVLLCRDIELACDERVIKDLDNEQRADYTQALVACSIGRRTISACPLAFGEVGVKERVRSVMNYKKPAFWIVLAAVVACAVVAVCFLTNPVKDNDVSLPALEDIREGYSEEQAIADGCVVWVGNDLVAGSQKWNAFVDRTWDGNEASIRIYYKYAEPDTYFVKDLSYDGDKYHLRFYDRHWDTNEYFLSENSYKYLIYSQLTTMGAVTDNYLLSDSPDVTAEGYFNALCSSVPRPEYEIYNHCYNIICVVQELLESNKGGVATIIVGSELWDFIPVYNSLDSFFRVSFDGDFTHVSASCTAGSFSMLDVDGNMINIPADGGLHWSPYSETVMENGAIRVSLVTKAEIKGTLWRGEEARGTFIISLSKDKETADYWMGYSVSVVCEGVNMLPSEDLRGGIITFSEYNHSETGQRVVSIVDRAERELIPCDTAIEPFYADENYIYCFDCIKSQYVIVTYSDGSEEDIVTALNNGRVSIADMDAFEIDYIVQSKQ